MKGKRGLSPILLLTLVGTQCYAKREAEAEPVPLWQVAVSAFWWKDFCVGSQGTDETQSGWPCPTAGCYSRTPVLAQGWCGWGRQYQQHVEGLWEP